MKKLHGWFFLLLFSNIALSAPVGQDAVDAEGTDSEQAELTPENTVDFQETSGEEGQDNEDITSSEPEPEPATETRQDEACKPISFTDPAWVSSANSNADGYPVITRQGELILIPDNRYGAGVAAIYPNQAEPPFEVQFEFSTYDDDGGKSPAKHWNSADGISFFFLSDGNKYGIPDEGGNMGLSMTGKGYAITFPMYDTRRVSFVQTWVRTIAQRSFSDAYSHGKWIPVSIRVEAEQVRVSSGKENLLSVAENWTNGSAGRSFGFSAATGAADAEHKIRNFCFRKL